uniref:Protein kinase putative n=1 Tax=Albugo laibachii Nc14 TaxID=890382 RepID=F0W7J0_9STRA|nr:protein kinase putative [Albugo laibachii Nc14]|eukprot:CCA17091.1 protein kinase putative [Albugo laibachii Nc14]
MSASRVIVIAEGPTESLQLESLSNKKDSNVNRPANTKWRQQTLPKWEPMLSLPLTILTCLLIGLSCMALGLLILAASESNLSHRIQYDAGSDTNFSDRRGAMPQQKDGSVLNITNCLLDHSEEANSFHANHTCFVNITLQHTILDQAYIFYELEGFYQNHRRFMSSVMRTQFTDEWRPGMSTNCAPLVSAQSSYCFEGICDPEVRNRELFPCGIVANTMFNDIFWLHHGLLPTGEVLGRTDLVHRGIARRYPSHNEKNPSWELLFDAYLPIWNNPNMSRIVPSPLEPNITPHITEDYTNSTAWVVDPRDPYAGSGVGLENEHWRVWVELAATQPFWKPFGTIDRTLPNGTNLVFAVQSNFYVRSFGGSKALIISDLTWFGSRNHTLGAFFIGIGVIFLLGWVLYTIRWLRGSRRLGDAASLAWKHKTT